MEDFDVSRLRNFVDQAIRNGETKRRQQEETEATVRELEVIQASYAARKILALLPKRIEAAERNNEHSLNVMWIDYTDWDEKPKFISGRWTASPEGLRGSARQVFDACVSAGLNPVLEFHSGSDQGNDWGIFVTWR